MVIEKILQKIGDFKTKNKRYPSFIYISERQYKRLKKELSIVEKITEDIKILYLIEFRIIEKEK